MKWEDLVDIREVVIKDISLWKDRFRDKAGTACIAMVRRLVEGKEPDGTTDEAIAAVARLEASEGILDDVREAFAILENGITDKEGAESC